ncbi:MAG TPA: DUF2069 domain-containing protein [Gammaproteobacteria bacterium]|nr:DUF2069 domain-containing protein [Gammaproteobacteria bacterium]
MNFRLSGRALTLAAMGLLVIWLLLWLGLLTYANRQQRILWLSLALLPIVIAGYHVWCNHKSGFAWCGFISLGYFAQGVTVVLTSKSDAGYAAVEMFLSLLCFIAASAALRVHRRCT